MIGKDQDPDIGKDTQFPDGVSGNPDGKPKGLKSWSTVVKKLLDDETFADKVISKRPGWWDELPNKDLASTIATAMMIKAVNGDHKAAEWVRKTGFGDRINMPDDDMPVPIMGGSSVQRDNSDPKDIQPPKTP